MVMVLEDWQFYGFAGLSLLFFFAGIAIFVILRNNAPDAFVHWKAARNGDAICRVHFRGGKCNDYVAEIDKAEKGLGTNMWNIPDLGIKFMPKPGEIEFIEGGSVPCVNYYEKLTVPIKMNVAIAFSQLKDWLAKIGLPIDGNEKELLYVMQEMQKNPIDRAIKNTRIDSEKTKEYLTKYLNAIKQKKSYLETLAIDSGVFVFQTAMYALDDAIAHTSAEVAHGKEVIRAAAKREEANNTKNLAAYAVFAFIICIGAAAFVVVLR